MRKINIMHIDINDAQDQLRELITKAKAGEEIIITTDDTEVQLVPRTNTKIKGTFPFGIMPNIKTSEDFDEFDDELKEIFGMND